MMLLACCFLQVSATTADSQRVVLQIANMASVWSNPSLAPQFEQTAVLCLPIPAHQLYIPPCLLSDSFDNNLIILLAVRTVCGVYCCRETLAMFVLHVHEWFSLEYSHCADFP